MEVELLPIRELASLAGANPGAYLVRGQLELARTKTAKNGKPFVELRLADGEGTLTLRAWSDHPHFDEIQGLKEGEFVEISGSWFEQESFGLDARDWRTRTLTAEEIEALLAGSGALREKQEADYAFIAEMVAGMADPRLRSVSHQFLEVFGERFRRTAAARKNHHARRGGLVEHVAQMMRSAAALGAVYPAVNRDLVLAGVLFHDCGKLWENCYAEKGFTMPYSDFGELLGHIPIGLELVNRLWKDCQEGAGAKSWAALEPPGDQVRLHLLHLIASHHGVLEYGSPVVPKTPEAFLLHYVDNIDAKMEMVAEAYEAAAKVSATVYDWVRPLGTRLVQPLPSVLPEAEQPQPD
jgi:3'-5' exoribonuclease